MYQLNGIIRGRKNMQKNLRSTARLYVDGDLVNLQESGPKSWVIKTLQLGDEELSAAIERVALSGWFL